MKYALAFFAFIGTMLIATKSGAMSLIGVSSLSYLGTKGTPAIRNNNPLNIRRSDNAWKGKIPFSQSTDKSFEQFKTFVYGLRAGIINLRTHYKRGKNTISELVTTWAPPSENNTLEYVNFVSNQSAISAYSPFVWNEQTVYKIVKAMATMEAGKDIVTPELFSAAWKLA